MSSDAVVIEAKAVTKRYLLGEREQYGALRDVLASGFRRRRRVGREELVALDDVSFAVDVGEVVGIIGRNGAGKSTLLKVLSRITAPSSGEVRMRGRIGSLLEVGSGFHPELTGTENVYLNGAILGMSRNEIRAKLDEIVAFAEMSTFMSTPVKHYSVGMFMRLAFAVAAHLDAEILVVDEVLAVGDARFQAKCLSKMGEVARSGRSVLFVSHNLDATLALCDRGLLLDGGKLLLDASAADTVDHYRRLAGVTTRPGDEIDLGALPRQGTGEARFTTVTVTADADTLRTGDRLTLRLDVEARHAIEVSSIGLTIGTEAGLLLVNLDTADGEVGPVALPSGASTFELVVPRLHLAPGRYRVGLRMANPVTTRLGSGAIDLLDPALVLQVDATDEPTATATAGLDATVGGLRVEQGAGSVIEATMVLCR